MSIAQNASLEQIAEMAARLAPTEQLKLWAQIGDWLRSATASGVTPPPRSGSAAALRDALRQMPHLQASDVDELERVIHEGSLPVHPSGAFDVNH